jgi:septum formation protein
MILPYPLILASASRGRADLLKASGFDFEQIPTQAPEPEPGPDADPLEHARRLARIKAEAGVAKNPGCLVLAADTVVSCEGRILGKPRDLEDAAAMLAFLGGRPHQIITALCLGFRVARPGMGPDRFESGEESAFVTLRKWDPARLRAHVERVRPLFCAGAYALQEGGSSLVSKIEGDPSAVVGLPLDLLDALLRRYL